MLHICLACDNNYVTLTKMCMRDLIARKNKDTEITFYILADNLADREKEFDIFRQIDRINIVIISLDSSRLIQKEIGRLPFTKEGITKTTFLRFLIPYVPHFKNVDRVLYIDSDILTRKDLTELYNFNLQGKAMGMTYDSFWIPFVDKEERMQKYYTRYNAGVMLMDLPALRKLDFTNKTVSMAIQHDLNDQCIMNILFANDILNLPPTTQFPFHYLMIYGSEMKNIDEWNSFHKTNYKSMLDIINNAFMYHFAGEQEKQFVKTVLQLSYEISKFRLNEFEKTGIVKDPTDDDMIIEKAFKIETGLY